MTPRARPFRDGRWVGPAFLALALLAWALVSALDGFGLSDLLAGAIAGGGGALLARSGALTRVTRGGRRRGGGRRDAAAPVSAALESSATDEMRLLLLRMCPGLGAMRVTLWERDAAAGVLRPLHSSHEHPPVVPVAGDPLAWALDQSQPLRLDRAPVWAMGPATAAPVPGGWVLTAEGHDAAPAPAALADAAVIAASFLALRQREQRAGALAGRFDRFVDFLKSLPGGAEAERFSADLAGAIGEIAGAEGAVVASWEEDRGRVLATWGSGGGPAPGTYFAVMQGELAMAARAHDVITRTPGGRPPVLAQPGERWSPVPAHLTAMPLADSSGRVRGVVAFWGHAAPEKAVTELITALAPLLALQLQHSTDLVRFRQVAHEDVLTGLRNRAALEERLADEHHRFHRYRRPVSLLVLDLDHFKRINDTWGHPAGDAVLERVADLVKTAIRDADFAARYGGEELVVLLPETMRREAGEVAERIRKAVADAVVEWNGQRIPVTASIGVSSCPEVVQEPAELMKSADAALYLSKGGGRNRVTVALPATSGG